MRASAILLAALAASSCGGGDADAPRAGLVPPALDSVVAFGGPAAPGSAEPFLAVTSDGALLMSWIEPASSGGHAVRFARLDGEHWSEPRTIAEATDFFVNWADFPSIIALPDGRLAAHWLQRSGRGTYAYDVRVAWSADGGANWSSPMTPHTDGTQTEHGFVSMFPAGERLSLIWLDGRNFANAGNDEQRSRANMTLRFASIDAGGGIVDEALIDDRTCECCQTDAAITDEGPIVVYRDRAEGEVRDIGVLRRRNGAWSQPAIVHNDGWVYPGCPVNGPSVAAQGRQVAVAWFTAAHDTARVRVAFSDDAGATFGPPIQVDDGAPAGRVDLLWLDSGTAIVSWLEHVGEDAEIRVRVVAPGNVAGSSTTVGVTSAGRSAGFPRMARIGDRLVFAWTVPGDPSEIRLAAATFDSSAH